jgi:hypothetical protein
VKNHLKKGFIVLYFLVFVSEVSFSQYCDRSFEIGGGIEYPLYSEKYNPKFAFDIYFYCIGLGTDFGLLFNNEPVQEFYIGRWIGTSFNLNLFTELDPTRISPFMDRFLFKPGYNYSQHTLTRINDLHGRTHYLYLKTEYCLSRWFMIYNKLDFKIGSNHNISNSDFLVSFGVRFFLNPLKRGFKDSPNYSNQ